MNFNSTRPTGSDFCRISLSILAGALCVLTGCNQPIYEVANVAIDPTSAAENVDSGHDAASPITGNDTENSAEERYEWPLSRTTYSVRKPPPMAYLTAFAERPQIPDPVTAPVVPWDDKDLDPRVSDFLHDAFDPFDAAPDPSLTIPVASLGGRNAFDVSTDGTRLVAIDAKGLALYRVQTGELIGHLPLPPDVAKVTPAVDAVRFAGEGRDMLVGSAGGLFLISGKNGSVVARHAGCGDEIANWQVTLGGQQMLIRTDGGQLFTGNCDLSDFKRCTISKTASFSAASLSPDGSRIGVIADQSPRVYRLVENQLVDQEDFPDQKLTDQGVVSMGLTTDCWTDGRTLLYHQFDQSQRVKTDAYGMYWRPSLISATTADGTMNSLLMVGERPTADGIDPVLFDLGPMGRNSSRPIRLPELPTRMSHSRIGNTVALLGDTELYVYTRRPWRCRDNGYASAALHNVIYEGKFEDIERLISVVRSQSCLGFSSTPEQLVKSIVDMIAQAWTVVETDHPDSEYLEHFGRWRDTKSSLAMTASAIRHRNIAWKARGNGYASTVTQKGWETFHERMKLATADVAVALAKPNPPINAYASSVIWTLDDEGELDAVDEICRKACQLFPGQTAVHWGVLTRLLPQWYGEPGDAVSFCRWASLTVDPPHSEWMYATLAGSLFYNLEHNVENNWKSFDAARFDRGLIEMARRGNRISEMHYLAWVHTIVRQQDQIRNAQYARQIISGSPCVFNRLSHGDMNEFLPVMMDHMDEFFSEAAGKTRNRSL